MLWYKPYMVLVQYSPMHWKMAKNDQWLLLCGHYPRLKKIFANRQEAFSICLGYKTFPPVPVGSKVFIRNGPQIPRVHFLSQAIVKAFLSWPQLDYRDMQPFWQDIKMTLSTKRHNNMGMQMRCLEFPYPGLRRNCSQMLLQSFNQVGSRGGRFRCPR